METPEKKWSDLMAIWLEALNTTQVYSVDGLPLEGFGEVSFMLTSYELAGQVFIGVVTKIIKEGETLEDKNLIIRIDFSTIPPSVNIQRTSAAGGEN